MAPPFRPSFRSIEYIKCTLPALAGTPLQRTWLNESSCVSFTLSMSFMWFTRSFVLLLLVSYHKLQGWDRRIAVRVCRSSNMSDNRQSISMMARQAAHTSCWGISSYQERGHHPFNFGWWRICLQHLMTLSGLQVSRTQLRQLRNTCFENANTRRMQRWQKILLLSVLCQLSLSPVEQDLYDWCPL